MNWLCPGCAWREQEENGLCVECQPIPKNPCDYPQWSASHAYTLGCRCVRCKLYKMVKMREYRKSKMKRELVPQERG